MSRVRLELCVRSLAPREGGPHRREIIEQVESLVETGTIDDYEVVVWGAALPTDTDHELGDRLGAFRAWAAETGAELVGVEERQTGSLVDEPYQVTTLPVLAVAEYHDDDLVAVTPSEQDGALRTVADHVGALQEAILPTEQPLTASD